MSKSRVVVLLLVSAGLCFLGSLLAAEKRQPMVSAWSLALVAAAFAVAVSAWRAARVVLLLAAAGACVVFATGLSDLVSSGLLLLAVFLTLWATVSGWRAAPSWRKRNRYDATPQNPWSALDKGIDPTE